MFLPGNACHNHAAHKTYIVTMHQIPGSCNPASLKRATASAIRTIVRRKSPNATAICLKPPGVEETRGALDALAGRFRNRFRAKKGPRRSLLSCAELRVFAQ